jgi:addiction module HigA family antidote
MRRLKPVTPGELLREEFLIPMGITRYRLAKEIRVPAQRIGEIVAGKRAITSDTDLRLCRFFGLSNGYWLRAQAAYDTEVAEAAITKTLAKIKPWAGVRSHAFHSIVDGQALRRRIGPGAAVIALSVCVSCGGKGRAGDADADAAEQDGPDVTVEADGVSDPPPDDGGDAEGDEDPGEDPPDGDDPGPPPDAADAADIADDDATPPPPPGPGGAFLWIGWYPRYWSVGRWGTELAWMRRLGMDTVIVAATVIETEAIYPTEIPGLTAIPEEPLEGLLSAADAAGMEVHLGLVLTEGWWTGTGEAYLDGLAALSMDVASELHSLYAPHPSLAGFYITQEIDNMTWTDEALRQRLAQRFLRPLSDHVKSLDASLVVSDAPFFNTVFQPASGFGAWWDLTLADVPSLDLVILQDGIGAEHATYADVAEYFTAVGGACAARGREF